MDRDLVYVPEIETAQCWGCKEDFKLYSVQKIGINWCRVCAINNRLSELITLPNILKKIIKFAEEKNEKIDDRLVVDISGLVKELQK